MKPMNKKGAEMTIGTIVIIILAIIVLVVLVYGFTTGWQDMWDNIVSFGGGKVNVQTVIQSCEIACSTQQEYSYCKKVRSVVFDENLDAERLTCRDLEVRGVGLSCDMNCPLPGVTCADLVESVCAGVPGCTISTEGRRTVESWIANEVGPGKLYMSVDILDGQVTDAREKLEMFNPDLPVDRQRHCVKLVRN